MLSAPLRVLHVTLGTNPYQETREEGANLLTRLIAVTLWTTDQTEFTAYLSKFRRTSRVFC